MDTVEGPEVLGRQDKVLIFAHGVDDQVGDKVGFQRWSQPGEPSRGLRERALWVKKLKIL